MNRSYQVIWNHAKSLFEVVSELGKSYAAKSTLSTIFIPNTQIKRRFKLEALAATIALISTGSAFATTYTVDANTVLPFIGSVNPSDTYSVKANATIYIAAGTSASTLYDPIKNRNGSIDLNQSGATLENWGSFTNYGSIRTSTSTHGTTYLLNKSSAIFNNQSTLATAGDVNIDNDGILLNSTSSGLIRANILNNSSKVENAGNSKINIRKSLNNLNNISTLTNTGAVIYLDNNAILDNMGMVENQLGGNIQLDGGSKIINHAGATFENSSQISVTGTNRWGTSSTIENHGEVRNDELGRIYTWIDNYGDASFYNDHDAYMFGSIYLKDNSVFENKGTFDPSAYMKGLVAEGTSHIYNRNGGLILLNPTQGSALVAKRIELKDQSTFDNDGSIIVSDGSDSNHPHANQAVISIDSGATLNNTSLLHITDTTLNSHLMVNGMLNNSGSLNLGSQVYTYLGSNEPNTTATLINRGAIEADGAAVNGSVIRMTGNGAKLISEAGSSFDNVELQLTYRNDFMNTGEYAAQSSLIFNGQANFNPSQIIFNYQERSLAQMDGTITNMLDIDVANGVAQTINANILRTVYNGTGYTHIYDGIVSKLGSGSLILNGQNNYGQGTHVKAGQLYIGDIGMSNASINGPVNVYANATLGGSGIINGNVNIADGGRLSAGTGLSSAAKLTVNGDLTLNAGSYIDYDMSDQAGDSINITGHLETNGATINVNAIGNVTTGLVREIFNYGTIGDDRLNIGSTPTSMSPADFTITNNTSQHKIYVSAISSSSSDMILKFWNPSATATAMGSGGSGIWSATGNSWTNLSGSRMPGQFDSTADFAIFGGNSGTVTIEGSVNAKGLQFLNDYTLNAGNLGVIELDSSSSEPNYISTGGSSSANNTITINAPIHSQNGINKVDGGTLILNSYDNTILGDVIVTEGTLQSNRQLLANGNLDIKQDGTFIYDGNAGYMVYDHQLSGTGNFVKSGSSELWLSGDNSFTGLITVKEGLLTGDSISIKGNVATESGTTLKMYQLSDGSYAGNISGAGEMIKEGNYTLTLTGTNSYLGGTKVNVGILQGNTDSLQGNINIANSAGLIFNQTGSGIFSGDITGLGNVTKTGAGKLTINGNVSSAGNVQIQQGNVFIGDEQHDSAVINGGVDVANGATIGGNGTINGTVNLQNGAGIQLNADEMLKVDNIAFGGNNTLEVIGLNNIGASQVSKTVLESTNALSGDFASLSGLNSGVDYLGSSISKSAMNNAYILNYGLSWYSNDSSTVTGNFTLANSSDSFAVNTALHDVSANMPAVNATDWDGNSLNKYGDGTLILNDINTYTGITNVYSGKLIVGGDSMQSTAQIAGDVDVKTGAILGGHGTILGSVNINSGATLAPGNSIGQFTVGNITFNRGSVLEIEAEANGSSDRTTVIGTATINGGTVAVVAGAGNWAANTSYTILTAANSIEGSGTFDNVTSNLAFLDPNLRYDNNNVYLDLTRNSTSLQDVAFTHNQRSTAQGIDSIALPNPISDAILSLSEQKARNAYDNLSGEIHASVYSALLNNARYLRNTVNQHLNGAIPVQSLEENQNLWVNIWGHRSELDETSNTATLDNNGFGILVGYDTYSDETTALGVALGYERTDLKMDEWRNAKADIDAVHLMTYGRTELGPVNLRGGLSYSWLDAHTERNVYLSGIASRYVGNYNGSSFQLFAEASHDINISSTITLEPYAGLTYASVTTRNATETGGAAALNKSKHTNDMTSANAGIRSYLSFDDKGSTVYADLGWQYNFSSRTPDAKLNFSGGKAFTVKGAKSDSNSGLVGVGIEVKLSPNMSLKTGYEGLFGNQIRDHELKAQWRLSF